jgi:hypoxanthine phosphoribosyltransferase
MEIVSLTVGLVGTSASVLGLYLVVPKFSSWRSVRRALSEIEKRLSVSGYYPDVIVLYGRGGAVFGGLLAGNLGNIPVLSIDREVLDIEGVVTTNVINSEGLTHVRGRNVLLVTGEVVTGTQLAAAKNAVQQASPKRVKTASYYVCEYSSCFPDFFWKVTKGVAQVPWRMGKKYRRTSKRAL